MNALAQKIVDRLSARMVERVEKYAFVESQHPRASDGEFATKSGGATGGAPASAQKPQPVSPDRAPWSMSPDELKQSGVKFYRTGQGSTYAYHPTTGQTIRVKTTHVGHDTKDVGLKKPSERTVYIDPEHARRIGMWQTSSANNKRIVIHDGHVYLTSKNARTGAQGMDEKPMPFSHAPSLGKSPLELNTKSSQTIIKGGEHWSGNHPGSPITDMAVPHEEGHRIITEAARAAGKTNVYQGDPASRQSGGMAASIASGVSRLLSGGKSEKYAKNRVASGQLGFGFKEDTGQKSFKWKEELHPRDAEGKFATEENKGTKDVDRDTAISNVPIDKRGSGSLDSQVDKWKADEAAKAKEKRSSDWQTRKDQKSQAKELFEKHGQELAERTAAKTGKSVKEVLNFLDQKVKWEPDQAVKLLDGFAKQKEQEETGKPEPVPSSNSDKKPEENKRQKVDEPEKIPRKFMTAGEAAMAGKSHNQWTGVIQDAFVNEEINDDHPAWQSILHGNAPTIHQYHDAQSIFGQHVRSMDGNTMGRVTGLSDDARTAIVTDLEGNKSIHGPETLHHLGADVTRRLQSAGHLSVKEHAKYLGRVLAQEAIENDENIGVTMKRHGISPTATEIRAAIAENVENLKSQKSFFSLGRNGNQITEALRTAVFGHIEKYRQSRDLDADGHWVTIDGRHVFIKDANAGDHAKSMGQLHRVKAEHVQHLMPEAHKFLKDQIDQREVAKAHARKLSRLNAGSIGKIENSYRDWSSVDGFDSIARDVALAHPELGFDPDDTDTPGKVWDLIREGKEEYPSADSKEVAELAAKWLKSSTPKKREVYPEDSLPFSRQARGDEADKYAFREEDHPRDQSGKFAEKDSDDSGRVKMRQAKAGGEVSDIDGKFYKGGHWLPVHGKYSGQEKPAKKPKQEGDSGPVFASESSKGPVMARQLSAEQIEEEKARDREQRDWTGIQSGPLGQLLRLGDRPHNIRGTLGDIRKWAELFEGGEITTQGLEDAEQFARNKIRQIEEEKDPSMTADDWQYYAGTVEENSERDREQYAPRNIKKLLNAHPAITNARTWVSYLLDASQDIGTLKEINDRLSGRAEKYSFQESQHPRDNLGQFTAKHQEAIRKARDTASQKRSAADAAAKALESAEQKWRESDDEDDSGLNAAYDAHEIASEEAENAQSAAEEAEQQARDELEGISDEVRAEIDSAKDEADELSEDHARVSKDIERLAKVAESKRTRATKLRERASRKQQVAEEARKKEDDARWGGSGSVEFWERYSGRYKAAEAIVEAAESEDATEEQEAAAEKAQQVIDKIDEMHEAALDKLTDKWLAADEAYENASQDAAVAEDEADEAESEVRQAQQELQEIASKWEAAKATAADLERRRLEIDNFRKSIGPALQGLFSPGVQKYSADKGEDRWITIGGSEDGNRKHAGGTPVKIDKEGKIVAGPDALAGKKVDELGGKNKTNEPTADKERLMSQEEEEEVKLQPKNTNKRDVPYQNPHTKKWHILNKKTGDKSDQGFETPGECQEAIDAPEFRPKKIGDRVYVVDRYGDKHWRWPDKSYDSIGQCQAEIDKKIEDDAESARKSSESRRKTQSSVPTFGPNGTHTILDNGPEK